MLGYLSDKLARHGAGWRRTHRSTADRVAETVIHGIEAIRCAHEAAGEQEAGGDSEDETLDGIHDRVVFTHPDATCDRADYRDSGRRRKNGIATREE